MFRQQIEYKLNKNAVHLYSQTVKFYLNSQIRNMCLQKIARLCLTSCIDLKKK